MSLQSETTSRPTINEIYARESESESFDNLNQKEVVHEENSNSLEELEVNQEVDQLDLDLESDDYLMEEGDENEVFEQRGYLNDFRSLQDRDSTFVFLFGKQQAGKTVLISSLIYHMGVDDDGALETRRRQDNLRGAAYLKSLYKSVREGYFMDRTAVGTLYELDLKYTPIKPEVPMNITFLEMSGEDLSKVELSSQSMGKLPDNIDVFMNCPDIDLVFLLVVAYDEASSQDSMMIDFLDYLKEKKVEFDLSTILLTITKWDRYDGVFKHDVEAFVREKMPLLYSRIKADSGSIARFSIGQVSESNDHIIRLNEERPDAIKRWLYKTTTNRKIKSNTSIFQSISELF